MCCTHEINIMVCLYILQNDNQISAVNICPHILWTNFFLIVKIFKIYSFINFQICDITLLIIVTMLYIISPIISLFYNWKFLLLDPFHPFLPPTSQPLPLVTTNWFLTLILFCFHSNVSDIMHYLSFPIWLILLSINALKV